MAHHGIWNSESLFAKVKSMFGTTCADVLRKAKFNRVVPMTIQADACKSMVEFTHDVGIPENLVTDGTGEFTRKDVKFVKDVK